MFFENRRHLLLFFAVGFLVGLIWTCAEWFFEARNIVGTRSLEISMKTFWLPVALGLASLGLAFSMTEVKAAEKKTGSLSEQKTPANTSAPSSRNFSVQVMGVQWINPVVRRSYPAQWNLLWVLGSSKVDVDDYDAKHDPDYLPRQGMLPAISNVVNNPRRRLSFYHYEKKYIGRALLPYQVPYFTNILGFYSIKKNGSGRTWYDLPVWFASSTQISAKDLKEVAEEDIYIIANGMEREFNPANSRPVVNVAQGTNAGFRSLSAAMDYLEANPDKTAWVMAMDAPDFPKDTQPTENSVVLILASANKPNERLPLALIHRVGNRPIAQFESKPGDPASNQAWKAALAEAAEYGNKTLADVGMTLIDTGRGADKTQRLTAVSRALTETQPDFDFKTRLFDTTTRIGDGQAAMSVVNLAMGIAYSHEHNTSVLVTDTADPGAAHAVLITPPPGHVAPDPNRRFDRATGEGRAYWPWWGARRDGQVNAYE